MPYQEQIWQRALDAGWTIAQIAAVAHLSTRQVYRRLRQLRIDQPEPAPADLPRLELRDSTNPRQCSHSARSTGDGVLYCLECDALSTDGGLSWLGEHEIPSMTILAPVGDGRRTRLHRTTAGREADPGGPTTYNPDPSLKGGRGRSSNG